MMRRVSCLVALIGLLLMVGMMVIADSTEQANNVQGFMTDIRIDLELLADRVFGGVRPEGWTSNADFTSPSYVADLWFENELLADAIFGAGVRSEEWIGATTRNVELLSRNIRHDLEVSADTFFSPDFRPDGWNGAALIYRCNRTIQNILHTLQTRHGTTTITPETVLNYCNSVSLEIDDSLVPSILGSEQESADFQGLIWAVRGDLERLADETKGLGVRPSSWIGNTDLNSPNLAADTSSDLERLADDLLGQGVRPEGWNGIVTTSLTESYRNLRQDLELLADAAPNIGPGIRPNGWQGVDPLIRCSADVQNLVVTLQQTYGFVVDASLGSGDGFCTSVTSQANNYAENPPAEVIEVEDTSSLYESVYAFAYLDQAALEYMGIMPEGIEFRAWYRNFNESTMMFVSGENFAVYIDRRWTTMPQDVFDRLPTLEGVIPLAFCDASWCNGPAPTPTPTGGGPLFDIVNDVTAPTQVATSDVTGGADKLQVSWNNIRVNYTRHLTDIGVAQVTLEICEDVSQVVCEPVISILNNNTGLALTPISQFNGLNVYELPYGYSTNFLIESNRRFSTDIWLNDPTLLTPVASSGGEATATPTATLDV